MYRFCVAFLKKKKNVSDALPPGRLGNALSYPGCRDFDFLNFAKIGAAKGAWPLEGGLKIRPTNVAAECLQANQQVCVIFNFLDFILLTGF